MGFVEQISTTTGEAIASAEVVSEGVDERSSDSGGLSASAMTPGLAFSGLRRRWLGARLKIEGTLSAYFSRELFDQWRVFSDAMENFFHVAAWEGEITKTRLRIDGKGRLGNRIVLLSEDERRAVLNYLEPIPVPKDEVGPLRVLLLESEPALRRAGVHALERFLLDMEASMTDRILAAAPNGFSTTRGDLIRDLLP